MDLKVVAVGTSILQIANTQSLDDVRHFLEEHIGDADGAIAVVFEVEDWPAVGVIADSSILHQKWDTTTALRRYLADFGVTA
jgi:hypothetical protein